MPTAPQTPPQPQRKWSSASTMHGGSPTPGNADSPKTESPYKWVEVAGVTAEVDEFGLPVRKPRRWVKLEGEEALAAEAAEQAEKKRIAEEAKDGSDNEDFVDAPSGSDDARANEVQEDKGKTVAEASISSKVQGHSPNGSPVEMEKEVVDIHATAETACQSEEDTAAKGAGEKIEDSTTSDNPTRDRSISNASMGKSPEKHTVRHRISVASEWSHPQLAPKLEEEVEEEEETWQTMPAYAPFDIYDDNNKLIAKEEVAADYEDEMLQYGTLGGAGKGYTRVQMDEDAQSATSMDDNTAYLFKDPAKSTNVIDEDDDPRDAIGQMQATKDLLTEGQRIAYVGTVRLTTIEMIRDMESLERTRAVRKILEFTSASMLMWAQKIMIRLYAHMEIGSDEQVMIEQLAEHGVQAGDLTPALMLNARVKNPNAELSSERPSVSSPRESTAPKRLSVASARTSIASPLASPALISTRDPKASSVSLASKASSEPLPPYDEHQERVPKEFKDVKSPSELGDAKNIDIDIRWTVLCDLFLILIGDGAYDARSRQLLEKVGAHLDVPWLDICRFEKRITDALEMQEAAAKENWNEDQHMETRRKEARNRRLVVMGLATVGGSLVIGLSAGLLAPVIGAGLAAGFTTIGVAGTSGFLAGAGGAAIVTTTGVLTGGTIGVRAADRRTGAVKTFEYRPLHNNKRVNLIVTISGWMNGKIDDVRLPFSTVDPIMGDIYSIYWEPEMLQSMGQTITILATEALTQTLQQVLGSTILVALMAALQLPVVLTKLAYLIDNPWSVSMARADLAGLILADSLIDRNLGSRPITLVGFSLGARVIYSCLRELAKKNQPGLIQNAYIFGAPVIASKDEFLRCKSVVSGRFLNGYATNDWILGYLFRATGGGIRKVAGLTAIDDVPGIENVNVTEWVPGHMSYRAAMPRLLREVGWEVESDEFTEIEDPDPDNHDKRQRELINEIEEARRQLAEKPEKKSRFGFWKKKKGEKKDWEMYDERSKGAVPVEGEISEEGLEKRAEGVLFDVDAIRKEVLEVAGQEIEVKQLESTLPPMKISMSEAPTPLKPTKSLNDSLTTPPRSASLPPPLPAANGNDEITMSFDEPHEIKRSPALSATDLATRPPLQSHATAPPPVNMNPLHNAWADDEEIGDGEIQMTFA